MGDEEEVNEKALVEVKPTRTTSATSTMEPNTEAQFNTLIRRMPLSDPSILPTLFPAPVADLITALSTSARISMRVMAFFTEAILEASEFTTRVGLGLTRRILISAISSARRMYLISSTALELGGLNAIGPNDPTALAKSESDAFFQVLDKYTNLGIYIIHHTFTLAELFAMSGFSITSTAVKSVHHTARESVALFDNIFGSNESSRALSSIITMVRRELLHDERFKAKDKGTVASLTALTKALTAFACLQTATWQRTSKRLKMRP